MRNLLLAAFCFCFVFVSTATAQSNDSSVQTAKINSVKKKKSSKQKKKPAQEQEFICQLPASVNAVVLSRTEIPAVCPPDTSCTQIIEVATAAVELENTPPLKYVYTISGGKIIGSGANVKWDLSGVKPGTYIITAAVDEGSPWGILGRTQTREVEVVE
ncbi:MAG TPA: hypothetical protein VF599_05280 [Pyrinomonadaceae bacterium]|jgi:hypothetical protein